MMIFTVSAMDNDKFPPKKRIFKIRAKNKVSFDMKFPKLHPHCAILGIKKIEKEKKKHQNSLF